MLTLGIETSSRIGSVALHRDGTLLAETVLSQQGRRHAQSLVAEIDALFRETQSQPADCDLVAVSIGPGSFTGLRVGVVCAKTFAYAVGCQVIAVDTLLAIAENAPDAVSDVWVVSDAQRGEIFAARYQRSSGGFWVQTVPITIYGGKRWCVQREPTDHVTGPGVEPYGMELLSRCHLLPAECRSAAAGIVARVGVRLFAAGRKDDLWSLEPFYMRPSAAEEKWDARQSSD